jgi:signal transduction histidine kinase
VSLLDDALLAVQDRPAAENNELVDVAALLKEEIEDKRAQGGRASFACGVEAELPPVLGNAVALRRLFANLIDNAVIYSHEARVTALAEQGVLRIAIEDSGAGIPAEYREQITQPFVRLEGSRSRRTGGAGLGLAIAKKVAESHGGRLLIGDAPSGGARIEVELPVFDAEGEGEK